MTCRAALPIAGLFASSLLISVASGGCASPAAAGDDAESSDNAYTSGDPLTVIKGRELGRCWFDVAGNDATLSCTSSARGDDPLESIVEVTAAGTGDPMHFVSIGKKLDVEAGGTIVVGTLPRTSFPIILLFNAKLTRESSLAVGNTKGTDLGLNQTINRPEDLSASHAAIMKQPFDVWPTAFLDADATNEQSRGGFTVSSEYSTSIKPYKGFLDETDMALKTDAYGRDIKGKVVYFLASPNTGSSSIALKLGVSNNSIPATLTGPGYYAVGASGLRIATTEEIARDFPRGTTDPATGGTNSGSNSANTDAGPSTPDPTGDAGGANSTDGDASVTPPISAADANTTCGGNGQARCTADNSCDTSTRWDSSYQICKTCGAHDQTYCVDDVRNVSGNKKCDPGTRWDSSYQVCKTCGSADKTYCVDDVLNVSGNKKCDDGTRWDSSYQVCKACGGLNQTYCVEDALNVSGNKKCNPGLHYDSSYQSCRQ